jgi:hypothetical protein
VNSSLRLHADDTTQYTTDTCPTVLEYSLNQDTGKLSHWFRRNFLQINADKTQAMVLGKWTYNYDLEIANTQIKTKDNLKILGVTLGNNLTFKDHTSDMIKKCVYMQRRQLYDAL